MVTYAYERILKMQKDLNLYESQISKERLICFIFNVNILPKHSDIHNYNTRNILISLPKYSMKKSEMS